MTKENQTPEGGPIDETLKAIFRVMNEMRSENAQFRDDVKGELQAIRVAVDDLPNMSMVTAVEDRLKSVQADTDATRRDVRQANGQLAKVISRLDRAHIPAE